jgi:hypothetical protein
MVYGQMPMMIFILASGYLLAIYLLLALAKRTGAKESDEHGLLSSSQSEHNQEVSIAPKVSEATSVH